MRASSPARADRNITGVVSVSGRARNAFNSPNPSSRGIITSDNTRSGRTPLSIKSSADWPSTRCGHQKPRLQQPGDVLAHVAVVIDQKDGRLVGRIDRLRWWFGSSERKKSAALLHVREIRQPALQPLRQTPGRARRHLAVIFLRHLCGRQMRGPKRNAVPEKCCPARRLLSTSIEPPCSLTSSTHQRQSNSGSLVGAAARARHPIKAIEQLRQGLRSVFRSPYPRPPARRRHRSARISTRISPSKVYLKAFDNRLSTIFSHISLSTKTASGSALHVTE